jgi:hypothetical protein
MATDNSDLTGGLLIRRVANGFIVTPPFDPQPRMVVTSCYERVFQRLGRSVGQEGATDLDLLTFLEAVFREDAP